VPSINLDEIRRTFFVFGWVKEPASPHLIEKIQSQGQHIQTHPIEGYGYFFYSTPFYVEIAETEDMVWIKSGPVHDGEKLLAMGDLLQNGWVCSEGIRTEKFNGSATVIGFMKHQPQCFIYRDLLSAAATYYWSDAGNLIASDNFRVMISMLEEPQLNEDVLTQHFIYREVYGVKTYVRDVYQLLGGELINWQQGRLDVDLARDYRSFSQPERVKPVNPETVEWFFQKLVDVVGVHLNGNHRASATMLSGGIDSSLIQAAINAQPNHDFPTFSYIIDSPGFAYEIKYAEDASRALDTRHTFVKLTPQRYAQGFIESTKLLGEPMADDARSCFLLIAEQISRQDGNFKYLFHGGLAGGLLGGNGSLPIYQGDKYRSWPIPVLNLLAKIASPISKSKAYGAEQAAQVLSGAKDENSADYFLNSSGIYSDLDMVSRCFSPKEIETAFADKRNLEKRYLDSNILVERGNTLDLITSSLRMRVLERAMGLYHGIEFVYPYADTAIVDASFTFDPMERYVHDRRAKPVLTVALESHVADLNTRIPKGWSGYGKAEFFAAMRDGDDFERKLENPDWFTWNMLTLDLFKKFVLSAQD
jgi:asparagine synthetase B (glutamine-hydrolysing)